MTLPILLLAATIAATPVPTATPTPVACEGFFIVTAGAVSAALALSIYNAVAPDQHQGVVSPSR